MVKLKFNTTKMFTENCLRVADNKRIYATRNLSPLNPYKPDMTPDQIQNKLNEAVMNIQTLQAELDKLKSNLSEKPNSYDHLLPAGYEFCTEEEAKDWVKVELYETQKKQAKIGFRWEPNTIEIDSNYKPYYRPIRPIQYHVAVHEAVTAEANPYAVDWSNAPKEADTHAFDKSGKGWFYGLSLNDKFWYADNVGRSPFTLPTGLDWKKSKTTRP